MRTSEGVDVAEGEGLGGTGGTGFFDQGEEIAAEGEGDAGFGGLVVVDGGAREDEFGHGSIQAEGWIVP